MKKGKAAYLISKRRTNRDLKIKSKPRKVVLLQNKIYFKLGEKQLLQYPFTGSYGEAV
jgi:hypothetical protein